MFQFSDEIEKNQFKGQLNWLFRVLYRENVDKARKNLRIEEFNEEEWKRIHTISRSLESVSQVIEETYNNVKEKIRKVGLDEYIDQLTRGKEDLLEWIKGVSLDLKQKLKIGVKFTGRKGISPDIETLSQLVNLKTYIRQGRGSIQTKLNSYQE